MRRSIINLTSKNTNKLSSFKLCIFKVFDKMGKPWKPTEFADQ